MDDLISRQASIDAVKRLSLGETDATRLAMRIEDYLERLQSAQPEQRWIPCSERLPEGGRVVLVTEKGGFIRHCEYANYCDFQEFQTVEEGLTVHDVIAWMPLPKPYKGEES